MTKKLNFKEVSLWSGVAMLTIATFFCTYSYTVSAPVEAIIWIFWLIGCGILAYFTAKGKQACLFAKEAKIELLKVVWPTRQETIQTTSIVMVMVAVMGFILWAIDNGMMWIIGKITHLG